MITSRKLNNYKKLPNINIKDKKAEYQNPKCECSRLKLHVWQYRVKTKREKIHGHIANMYKVVIRTGSTCVNHKDKQHSSLRDGLLLDRKTVWIWNT